MKSISRNLLAVLTAVMLGTSACGGGGTTISDPPGPGKSDAVSSLDEVGSATIQIIAEGAFMLPDSGAVVGVGSGSGFFIDSSGLAVTNNHVVSGATSLKVYIQGEAKPRFAKVIALSECSDLAVIDVEGEDFSFLDWSAEEITVGLDVYAAGFPLGDPEFTMTKGIISKTSSEKVSTVTGPLNVIEHDAGLQPGNSGGPLVDENGGVVGVNYLLSKALGGAQFFAIAPDEAIPVVEQLKDGVSVNTIGINGEPVDLGSDKIGIWVVAVMSGFPADKAGVKPGDVLLTLEDVPVAPDKVMAPYCDILRSHDLTDPLKIKVYRPSTQQILEGQLNGRPLEPVASLAPTTSGSTGSGSSGGTSPTPTPTPSASYVTITDNSNTLSIQVPASWTDVASGPWSANGTNVGPGLMAAPNINDFATTWTTPGLFFAASRTLAQTYNETTILDDPTIGLNYSDYCTHQGRQDYTTSSYTGKVDIWNSCGGINASIVILSLMPPDKSYLMILLVQVTEGTPAADVEAILNSFQVIGSL